MDAEPSRTGVIHRYFVAASQRFQLLTTPFSVALKICPSLGRSTVRAVFRNLAPTDASSSQARRSSGVGLDNRRLLFLTVGRHCTGASSIQQEIVGAYCVICWYGPIPMAPRIHFRGVARSPPCLQGSSSSEIVGEVPGGDAVEAAHLFLEPTMLVVDVVDLA